MRFQKVIFSLFVMFYAVSGMANDNEAIVKINDAKNDLMSAVDEQAPSVEKRLTFPYVVHFKGEVNYSDKDENLRPVKEKTSFIDTAVIETGDQAEVEILVDPTRRFFLGPNTKLNISSISRENQEVSDLVLVKGFMRWKALEESAKEYQIKLHSDLFSIVLPHGHMTFEYFRERARLEVKLFNGELKFAQLNGEFPVDLSSGDGVNFTGRISEGEIEYDFLLQGRKIPKGKLSPKYRLSEKDMNLYSDEAIKKKEAELKKQEELKRKAVLKKLSKLICQNPGAEANECHWKKEKGNCVRYRCNVQGQWSDRVVLGVKDVSQCNQAQSVRRCNY